MSLTYDRETGLLVGGVIAVLILASLIGWILARRPGNDDYRATIANLNARTRAWWLMVAIFFPCHVERRNRLGPLIRADVLSGPSRVYYDDSDQTRRPWHIAMALLRDH